MSRASTLAWPSVALASALTLLGCVTPTRDRGWVDGALRERLGHGITAGDEAPWPAGVAVSDGLDEDEVVAVALWRSPVYRADLTRLDAARATLDEASRPANPQITVMGPFGPVAAIATLLAPLESLWQIPQRTEAASRDVESVAESLVSSGLDLARDAQLAHAELGLATDRVRVRAELASASAEVARIGAVRARVGESTALESSIVGADARVAGDASATAETQRLMARASLAALLALDEPESATLSATFVRPAAAALLDLDGLLRVARTTRPDVRAAELAISAAAARAGWERSRVVALAASVEGQWSEAAGPSLRVGGRIELPIFSANQGGIGRADAEVARLEALLEAIARRVVLELTLAHRRLTQASSSLGTFRVEVLPALEEAMRVTTSSFESGDETYLVVLDALRRLGEARLREAELVAETRRARAELERALGARLATTGESAGAEGAR